MANKLPEGSLVLVSGANGFIASHIVDQLLKHNYRVRGTVRSVAKNEWLKTLFDEKYGKDKFELVEVPVTEAEGAFDEAVKGVSAFAHVATNTALTPDPSTVIPSVVDSTKTAIKAAAKEPGLKSFVLTSSSTATTKVVPGRAVHVTRDSWNEEEVKEAWAPPPYQPERLWVVYAASKTQGEQAAWEFVKENKPHFTFNAVLPNLNLGPILDPSHQHGSTAGWMAGLLGDQFSTLTQLPPQWYVNVVDDALLHVAALTDLDIKNERILAYGEKYTWNKILGYIRKARPELKVPEDLAAEDECKIEVDNQYAEEILKSHFGRGWTSLEQGVLESVAHLQ